jgi:hypothetical protein
MDPTTTTRELHSLIDRELRPRLESQPEAALEGILSTLRHTASRPASPSRPVVPRTSDNVDYKAKYEALAGASQKTAPPAAQRPGRAMADDDPLGLRKAKADLEAFFASRDEVRS